MIYAGDCAAARSHHNQGALHRQPFQVPDDLRVAPRSPMLEPREVIQTQLEMRGSENNTHLFLPCLGWVGIRGSPEKQASLHRCQAGARRFLKRSRLDGARTQPRAQVQHAGHPGNSLYVWQMSTPDTRTGNWRRYPQLFSDVQKTGPNGWSAARRAASRESLCPGSSQII